MTATVDEIGSGAFAVEVAWTVADVHRSGRGCRQCTPDGCEQLAWAERTLAEHHATRASLQHR